MSSNFYNFKCW